VPLFSDRASSPLARSGTALHRPPRCTSRAGLDADVPLPFVQSRMAPAIQGRGQVTRWGLLWDDLTAQPSSVGGASGEQSNRHWNDERADRRHRQDVEASQ